jgi:hypothetical protein
MNAKTPRAKAKERQSATDAAQMHTDEERNDSFIADPICVHPCPICG